MSSSRSTQEGASLKNVDGEIVIRLPTFFSFFLFLLPVVGIPSRYPSSDGGNVVLALPIQSISPSLFLVAAAEEADKDFRGIDRTITDTRRKREE